MIWFAYGCRSEILWQTISHLVDVEHAVKRVEIALRPPQDPPWLRSGTPWLAQLPLVSEIGEGRGHEQAKRFNRHDLISLTNGRLKVTQRQGWSMECQLPMVVQTKSACV